MAQPAVLPFRPPARRRCTLARDPGRCARQVAAGEAPRDARSGLARIRDRVRHRPAGARRGGSRGAAVGRRARRRLNRGGPRCAGARHRPPALPPPADAAFGRAARGDARRGGGLRRRSARRQHRRRRAAVRPARCAGSSRDRRGALQGAGAGRGRLRRHCPARIPRPRCAYRRGGDRRRDGGAVRPWLPFAGGRPVAAANGGLSPLQRAGTSCSGTAACRPSRTGPSHRAPSASTSVPPT